MTTLVDEQIRDLELEVKSGEKLEVRLANFTSFSSAKIHVKVQNNGAFDGAFADFSQGNGKFELVVELLGEGAVASWRYAGISDGESQKTIDASVLHEAPNTQGEVSQHGIAMGKGRLSFVGTSHIHNGMVRSETSQKEKIIVFDPEAVGQCSPILRIDENDVSASHSAIVGKLSDEHLFYMLSRGIDLETAKRLLTLGFLKPITAYFDEKLSQRILDSIEGGL